MQGLRVKQPRGYHFCLHIIVKWVGVLIEKVVFVKIWLKQSNFEPTVKEL